jgi:hypothetical protein
VNKERGDRTAEKQSNKRKFMQRKKGNSLKLKLQLPRDEENLKPQLQDKKT